MGVRPPILGEPQKLGAGNVDGTAVLGSLPAFFSANLIKFNIKNALNKGRTMTLSRLGLSRRAQGI